MGEAIARGQALHFEWRAKPAARERTSEERQGRRSSPFPLSSPPLGSPRSTGFSLFHPPPPLFHFFPALRSLVLSYWKKCSSTQRRTYYFEMLSSSSQVQSKPSDKIFRNVRIGLDVRSYQQLMPRKYFSQPSSRQQRENLL